MKNFEHPQEEISPVQEQVEHTDDMLGEEKSFLEKFRGKAGKIAKMMMFVSALATADNAEAQHKKLSNYHPAEGKHPATVTETVEEAGGGVSFQMRPVKLEDPQEVSEINELIRKENAKIRNQDEEKATLAKERKQYLVDHPEEKVKELQEDLLDQIARDARSFKKAATVEDALECARSSVRLLALQFQNKMLDPSEKISGRNDLEKQKALIWSFAAEKLRDLVDGLHQKFSDERFAALSAPLKIIEVGALKMAEENTEIPKPQPEASPRLESKKLEGAVEGWMLGTVKEAQEVFGGFKTSEEADQFAGQFVEPFIVAYAERSAQAEKIAVPTTSAEYEESAVWYKGAESLQGLFKELNNRCPMKSFEKIDFQLQMIKNAQHRAMKSYESSALGSVLNSGK